MSQPVSLIERKIEWLMWNLVNRSIQQRILDRAESEPFPYSFGNVFVQSHEITTAMLGPEPPCPWPGFLNQFKTVMEPLLKGAPDA